jgi:hypothetical protein
MLTQPLTEAENQLGASLKHTSFQGHLLLTVQVRVIVADVVVVVVVVVVEDEDEVEEAIAGRYEVEVEVTIVVVVVVPIPCNLVYQPMAKRQWKTLLRQPLKTEY